MMIFYIGTPVIGALQIISTGSPKSPIHHNDNYAQEILSLK